MQALIAPLNELAEFEELYKNRTKERGMIRVCGCVNSQKTHMMYALSDGLKYKVIACSSESKAKQVYEEYRFLDGFSQNKHKGASKIDSLPLNLYEEITINSIDDYARLIPDNLPEQFTSKDFKKAARVNQPLANVSLNILNFVGAVTRVGKRGNLFVYEKNKGAVSA